MMADSKRLIGVFALSAFVLMAGSVVCLTSGQPSAMADCGNQMQGASMCPFMSASVPTVLTTFGKQLAVILILVLMVVALAGVAAKGDDLAAIRLSSYRSHSAERPPISFLDSVLALISSGVLHSRIFGF